MKCRFDCLGTSKKCETSHIRSHLINYHKIINKDFVLLNHQKLLIYHIFHVGIVKKYSYKLSTK